MFWFCFVTSFGSWTFLAQYICRASLGNKSIYAIKENVQATNEAIQSIVLANFLFGGDSVFCYNGLGKLSLFKKLKDSKNLLHLWYLKANLEQRTAKATCLVSNCYGYAKILITKCHIKTGYPKTYKHKNIAFSSLQGKRKSNSFASHSVLCYNRSRSPCCRFNREQNFWPETSNFCYVKKYRHRLHFNT